MHWPEPTAAVLAAAAVSLAFAGYAVWAMRCYFARGGSARPETLLVQATVAAAAAA